MLGKEIASIFNIQVVPKSLPEQLLKLLWTNHSRNVGHPAAVFHFYKLQTLLKEMPLVSIRKQ